MVMRVSREDFSVETRDRLSYFLVIISGSFTIKNLLDVKNIVSELMDGGTVNIIFDLAKTTHMDSSSLGLIGNLKKRLEDKDGDIGILNPSEPVFKLMTEVGLARALAIYESLESLDEKFED